MAAHKLILLPADPDCPAVSTERLARELQAIGLIGPPRQLHNDSFYPTGEHFLQLIPFLGCSPMINLAVRHAARRCQTGHPDFRHGRLTR